MSKEKLSFIQLVKAFWKPYVHLLQYLKTYRKRFILGLVFGSLAGVLNGIFPLVIKLAGDAILEPGQSVVNPSQLLKSGVDSGPGIEKVFWIALLIPAAMVA
ncbi:MAG: hypothetical protein WCG76_09640, partial [Verrucomicrobiota bacterium]